MPLLKGTAGKAMPDMAIGYITRKDKAKYIAVQNLFIDEDYSAQFKETAARFGKYTEYDERKYYHFKLSPDQADHADPFMVQAYAKAYAEKAFPDCECVIATHTDTKTVHAHIIVNAVHPLTGRKLRFTESRYTKLKDMANEIGRKFGLSALDFRKKAQNKRTAEETHIMLKGGTSWKEDLREVIEEGKRTATCESEFIAHLAKYGVSVTRSKTEYSYLHPEKQKAIRGLKLGQNYTKSEVLNVIEKHGNRTNGNTACDVAGNERTGQAAYQNRFAQRSVSDIEREMQQIDRDAEQAHRGNAGGYGGDGVQSDNNRGQSGTGNQNGNRENREAQREHRNTSQKGGFDFCK